MKNFTKDISPDAKIEEVSNKDIEKTSKDISDSLDTIALYLFKAIKRNSNQQFQREGA